MKAAVYNGPYNIKIKEVTEPEVMGRKVRVKFKAGSICGTDMHFYRGDWKWMKKGTIIGHDAWGIREDTGDRVVMVPIVNCGHCYYCLKGLPTYCVYGKFYGLSRDGFFAESKVMLPRNLISIPSNVCDDEAAIIEPVALALHVLDYVKPNLGDWVTIIGQGPIGLLMTQIAKLKGCRVVAVDLDDFRLELRICTLNVHVRVRAVKLQLERIRRLAIVRIGEDKSDGIRCEEETAAFTMHEELDFRRRLSHVPDEGHRELPGLGGQGNHFGTSYSIKAKWRGSRF